MLELIENDSLWKVLSAIFYGISSFSIMIINKSVLTSFHFPSFQALSIGGTKSESLKKKMINRTIFLCILISLISNKVRCWRQSSCSTQEKCWAKSVSPAFPVRLSPRSGLCPCSIWETLYLVLAVPRYSASQ